MEYAIESKSSLNHVFILCHLTRKYNNSCVYSILPVGCPFNLDSVTVANGEIERSLTAKVTCDEGYGLADGTTFEFSCRPFLWSVSQIKYQLNVPSCGKSKI